MRLATSLRPNSRRHAKFAPTLSPCLARQLSWRPVGVRVHPRSGSLPAFASSSRSPSGGRPLGFAPALVRRRLELPRSRPFRDSASGLRSPFCGSAASGCLACRLCARASVAAPLAVARVRARILAATSCVQGANASDFAVTALSALPAGLMPAVSSARAGAAPASGSAPPRAVMLTRNTVGIRIDNDDVWARPRIRARMSTLVKNGPPRLSCADTSLRFVRFLLQCDRAFDLRVQEDG